mgnify:CR=1 FL=1
MLACSYFVPGCAATASCVILHWRARACAVLVIGAGCRDGVNALASDLVMFCMQVSPGDDSDRCVDGDAYSKAAVFLKLNL